MSRTKGALNKPKPRGNSLFTMNFEKQIEGAPFTKPTISGWVNWGARNNYPNLLLDLYQCSPTHRACINFAVQSIVGNGVDTEAMKIDGSQIVPNYYESWDDILRNLSLDFALYGSFALQIIRNKDGQTYSFYHIPLEKVRWSEYDEDGQITSYWICNDWTATSKYPPIQVDAFDMREDSEIKGGKPYLYVYRQYSPTQVYYTSPHYTAGIKAIQTEIDYLNYDLKTTKNSFAPVGVLTLPDVETDEQKQAILESVRSMFTGSNNANSIMINFRSNVDDNKVEYTPFTTNNGNVNLYDSSNERTVNRIMSAHQIPSKTLIGLVNGNSGFNSEGNFLEAAYSLYNTLVGNFNRNTIVKTVNNMLRMNGVDTELVLKPLTFELDKQDEEPKNDTNTEVSEKEVGENKTSNIEEKEEGNNRNKN